MALFIAAYVSNIGALSNVPTLLIIGAITLTFLRIFSRTNLKVDRRIARPLLVTAALAGLFSIRQAFFTDTTGSALALKIFLYHATFLSGLLVGFYDEFPRRTRTLTYTVLLFFIPLAFFLIFAKGNPPRSDLFVFNRNPFAGYTISASAFLLGFGLQKQPLSIVGYILIVCAVLVANSTLGALLAFLLAVLIYLGPQIFLSTRLILSMIAISVFLGLPLALYLAYGGAQEVEAFARLSFVAELFWNIYQYYNGSWLELDMATAVRFAPGGELDMSAAFRILHWIDILSALSKEGNLLSGGGTDWINENKAQFVYPLAAHNEYVRILAEQGLVFGTLLIGTVWAGIWSLRRNLLFLPLAALTIYFGTENLMNDFATTCIFFFIFGHTVAASKRSRFGPSASNG